MSYTIWLQILMELALSVSRERETQSLISAAGRAFLKKLDGIMFRVYEIQGKSLNLYYSIPKQCRNDAQIMACVTTFLAGEQEWQMEHLDNGYLYLFKLNPFGIMVFLRAEQLDPLFLNELHPVIEMFSTHINACESFRKQDEVEKFQRMLMALALRFINVEAADVDVAVNQALKDSCEYFNIDRGYVFSYDFINHLMHNTHEWCSEGIEPAIELLQDVPTDPFLEVWVEKHQRGELLVVGNVEALDKESALYEILSEQAIKSLITIPMMHQSECIGFVGFDAVQSLKYWSEHEISLLKVLAEMFTNLELKRLYERQLVEAKKLAEAASKAKSNFLANMSHEIRTPLNGIVGMSYLLSDTNLDEHQKDYLKIINDSIEALMGIINNILDFSKIESGQFKLSETEFNFEEEIFRVCNMLNSRASEKALEWIVDYAENTPKRYKGDDVRLRQILINLMGNAVKFTPKGSITIKISTENAFLRFSIIDTGIGISPKAQREVFEQFTQEDDSSTKQYEGTGLGLAITKQLVELMGGTIELESEVGKGSCFTVKLPLIPVQSVSDIHFEKLTGIKALVVDDHPTNLEIIRGYLEQAGIDVTCALNGVDAIIAIEKNAEKGCIFDIMLIDMVMPGMDGLMLHQMVRSKKEWDTMRCVLLSSAVGTKRDMEYIEEGFSAILSKPFSKTQLLQLIMQVLEISEHSIQNKSHLHETYFEPDQRWVLVVDDNEVNRMMVKYLLQKSHYSVDEAKSGIEAIAMCNSKTYYFVLMDIQMPEMDGYETTRIIRTESQMNQKTPIIAITANAMEQDRMKSFECGMDGHIAKPFKVEDLMEIDKKFNVLSTVFDKKSFENQFSDDIQFGKEIVRIFKNDLHKFIHRIEEAYQNQSFTEIKDIAHELKGASGYACAKSIEETCAELMERSTEKAYKEIEHLILKLTNLSEAFIRTVDM